MIKKLNIFLQVDFNPWKLPFLRFFWMFMYKNEWLLCFLKKSDQKVDIKPSNVCQEFFDNENQAEFFKLNFNPSELKFVRFFEMFLCKIELSSLLKKSAQNLFLTPLTGFESRAFLYGPLSYFHPVQHCPKETDFRSTYLTEAVLPSQRTL